MKEKELLRAKYLLLRKKINDKEIKSNIIFNKLISLDEYKNAQVVALYYNLKDEVYTKKLIDYSIKRKIVLLPKVEGLNINFYKINKRDILIKSKFGIMEPIGQSTNLYDIDNIDLIIVPGISFDKEKNRLGYGKGYYDKYLNDICNTIGICYEEQIVDRIPTTKNDVKMKKIVTDKNIY